MKQRFLVVGDPIAHSLSPRIHRAFGEQLGIDVDYRAERVAAGELAGFVASLDRDVVGLNLTSPLKHEAFALADRLSDAAAATESVNTLIRHDGGWTGETTDGTGLVRDLINHLGVAIAGQRLLILGAGGAVAAILPALLAQTPRQALIANRTRQRADVLAARYPGQLQSIGIDQLADTVASDILINGLAAGLHGKRLELPDSLFASAGLVYDLSYGAGASEFLARAHRAGARQTSDGLGMLVEQAAAAFALWHRRQPDSKTVLAELRRQTAP